MLNASQWKAIKLKIRTQRDPAYDFLILGSNFTLNMACFPYIAFITLKISSILKKYNFS